MKYEVIKSFVDLQGDNHLYRVGDPFPCNGADVSEERIDELASDKNRCGIALIKSIEEPIEVSEEKTEDKPKKKNKKEK